MKELTTPVYPGECEIEVTQNQVEQNGLGAYTAVIFNIFSFLLAWCIFGVLSTPEPVMVSIQTLLSHYKHVIFMPALIIYFNNFHRLPKSETAEFAQPENELGVY